MEIALIIAGGLTLMTFFAAGFDFLTKRRNKLDQETKDKVAELEKRMKNLESAIETRDSKIEQIESDVAFYKNLIEKK